MQKPILIAMAGLPGSGKSALAARLAAALPAVIINKDTVWAAVFPRKRSNTPLLRTISFSH